MLKFGFFLCSTTLIVAQFDTITNAMFVSCSNYQLLTQECPLCTHVFLGLSLLTITEVSAFFRRQVLQFRKGRLNPLTLLISQQF